MGSRDVASGLVEAAKGTAEAREDEDPSEEFARHDGRRLMNN